MNPTNKRVPLTEATEAQLREFATNTLGLDVKQGSSLTQLQAAISKAWSEPTIIVSEAQQPAPAASPKNPAVKTDPPGAHNNALVPKDSHRDPRVVLIVSRQEGPGGDRSVEVSVNGTLILIPRGEQVSVAYRYYEALKNAVQTVYDQDRDNEIISRDVHAYPFQVVSMPSEAEVSAWLASESAAA